MSYEVGSLSLSVDETLFEDEEKGHLVCQMLEVPVG